MTTSTDSYLAFLSEVEAAITEALESGRLALSEDKLSELCDMKREIHAVREAMIMRRQATSLPLMAAR